MFSSQQNTFYNITKWIKIADFYKKKSDRKCKSSLSSLSISFICLFQVVFKEKIILKLLSKELFWSLYRRSSCNRLFDNTLIINILVAKNKKSRHWKKWHTFFYRLEFFQTNFCRSSLCLVTLENPHGDLAGFFFVVSEVWSIRWQPVAKCL